jgi:hypothetical protein
MSAEHAVWTMIPHCKKLPKPSHLLGKARDFKGMTAAEVKEHYRQKRARARKRR